eukprot:859273-Rhodomonas_salina.2
MRGTCQSECDDVVKDEGREFDEKVPPQIDPEDASEAADSFVLVGQSVRLDHRHTFEAAVHEDRTCYLREYHSAGKCVDKKCHSTREGGTHALRMKKESQHMSAITTECIPDSPVPHRSRPSWRKIFRARLVCLRFDIVTTNRNGFKHPRIAPTKELALDFFAAELDDARMGGGDSGMSSRRSSSPSILLAVLRTGQAICVIHHTFEPLLLINSRSRLGPTGDCHKNLIGGGR